MRTMRAVMALLLNVALLLPTAQPIIAEDLMDAMVTLGTISVRIQSLGDDILRIEEIGALGPLDNATNLAIGRDTFVNKPVNVVSKNSTGATLETATLRIELSLPKQQVGDAPLEASVVAGFPTCPGLGHVSSGFEPVPPVNRAKKSPNGMHADSIAACCSACKADPSCIAFVSSITFDEDAPGPNCWPLATGPNGNYSVRAASNRIVYDEFAPAPMPPTPPPPPPPPPSLHMTIGLKANGMQLYSGPVGHAVSYTSSIPTPQDLFLGTASPVYAVRDSPRFVAPKWGATPAPQGSDLGPLANTSGFDTRYAAQADCYFFIINGVTGTHTKESALEGYGDFRARFFQLFGEVPLLPDWAWGFWFTWYHPYNQTEKTDEIKKFIADKIPLDVVSLDMDWRDLSVDYLYRVNTTLFPDMPGFFKFVHDNGLKAFFNDHPAPLGFQNGTAAEAPEMSPAEIKFRWDGQTSILDLGLDFWWFDCHWKFSVPPLKLPGSGSDQFDYQSWGQRVFWDVMTRYYREQRPQVNRTVMLGCSGSQHPASHRTPVWWTGDNQYNALAQAVSDEIDGGIKFKPYVHPDCTGHHGIDEVGNNTYPPEVYARWVQFCTFGTIYRIHSSHMSKGRRPWSMGPFVEDIMRNFTKMRYSMLPMIVSAASKVTSSGLPLVRRLDLEWIDEPQAIRMDQYLLGDDILVAPIDPFAKNTSARSDFNSDRQLWLPPGKWINAFSGEVHTAPSPGGQNVSLKNVLLTESPIFHRGDGMLVSLTDNDILNTKSADWSRLTVDLHIFRPTKSATVKRTISAPEFDGQLDDTIQLRKFTMTNGTILVEVDGTFQSHGAWKFNLHTTDDTKVCDLRLNGVSVVPQQEKMRQLPFGYEAAGATYVLTVPMAEGRQQVHFYTRSFSC